MKIQIPAKASALILAATKQLHHAAQKLRPLIQNGITGVRSATVATIRKYRGLQAINQGRIQGGFVCAATFLLFLASKPASAPKQQPVAANARLVKVAEVSKPSVQAPVAKREEKKPAPKSETVAQTAAKAAKTVSVETAQSTAKVASSQKPATRQMPTLGETLTMAVQRARSMPDPQPQIQLPQMQRPQSYQLGVQGSTSEAANYEMQRYRRQMTGRPGF